MLKRVMNHALKQGGNSAINRERLKRQLSTFDRVNLGCGDLFVENWLNIGLFSNRFITYGTVKKVGAAYALHFDLTKDLPLETGTVVYLYASHFIEHLAFDQAHEFLRRCHRVMRQEGILRLTTPDLELWIRKYSENDLEFFERFYQIEQSYPALATKGQILVGQIQGWTHRWLYDYSSLEDILVRAGFSHVAKRKALESLIPDIEKLEPRSEFRLMETLCVEARK